MNRKFLCFKLHADTLYKDPPAWRQSIHPWEKLWEDQSKNLSKDHTGSFRTGSSSDRQVIPKSGRRRCPKEQSKELHTKVMETIDSMETTERLKVALARPDALEKLNIEHLRKYAAHLQNHAACRQVHFFQVSNPPMSLMTDPSMRPMTKKETWKASSTNSHVLEAEAGSSTKVEGRPGTAGLKDLSQLETTVQLRAGGQSGAPDLPQIAGSSRSSDQPATADLFQVTGRPGIADQSEMTGQKERRMKTAKGNTPDTVNPTFGHAAFRSAFEQNS